MSELFSENEVACDSPRLKWMKRNQIRTRVDPAIEEDPWCCWVGEAWGDGCAEGWVGCGNTEEEAILDWCVKSKRKNWMEEEGWGEKAKDTSSAEVMPPSGGGYWRPSMLPKLAQCSQYRPEPEAGEAAERGTRIDALFRALIEGEKVVATDPEELAAAEWAVNTFRIFCGDIRPRADEPSCRVELPDFAMNGTADGVCRDIGISVDLKSGSKRNYLEQQACYALGFMDQEFRDEWVVYLLYCDLQEVETLRFTREAAAGIIMGVLARQHDPPTVNDYCSWCARRFDCPARREEMGFGLVEKLPRYPLEDALNHELVAFALWGKLLEEHVEEARRLLKERALIPGAGKIEGVKLVPKKGTEKVDLGSIPAGVSDQRRAALLALAGKVSAEKVRELWPDLPPELIEAAPGRVELHLSKPQKGG